MDDFVDELSGMEDGFSPVVSAQLSTIMERNIRCNDELSNQRKNIERRSKTMMSMFDELDVQVLAQQMYLHNFELYKNIHPIEFLNQIWRKKDDINMATPNLDYFSARFDIVRASFNCHKLSNCL